MRNYFLLLTILVFTRPVLAAVYLDLDELQCQADNGQVHIKFERKLIRHGLAQFFVNIQKKGQKKNEAEVLLVEGVILENRCQLHFFAINPGENLFGMRFKYKKRPRFPLELKGTWNLKLDKLFLTDKTERKVSCTVPNMATYQKMFLSCIKIPKPKPTPKPRPTRIPEEDLENPYQGGESQGGAKSK